MRLGIKIGLVPEPPPLRLSAGADDGDAVGKWLGTSLDLKTLVAALGIVISLVTTYVASTRNAAANAATQKDDVATLTRRVDDERNRATQKESELGLALQAQNNRFNETVVSRSEIDRRFNAIETQQLQTQQLQFLSVMPGRVAAGR